MIHESLHWLQEKINARWLGAPSPLNFSGVSTDTRQLKPNEVFFCLMGVHDGHQFGIQALDFGAKAIIIDEKHVSEFQTQSEERSILVVKDTLVALGELAKHWRFKFSIPVIALTGSNGKTTTKELSNAILSTQFEVCATQGNLNNLIGVPQTLFTLQSHHQIALIEMGMNQFGEIARLTEIAHPTVGLITNIGLAHLEKLGGLQGVAQAKGELFAGLAPSATALVNAADPLIVQLKTSAKKIHYGSTSTDLYGEVLAYEPQSDRPLKVRIFLRGKSLNMALKLPGRHHLNNILSALAIADFFEIPLEQSKEALEAVEAPHARMERVRLREGQFLLDDSYNANPSSMKAAIETLAELKAKQEGLAILGDMLELGEDAPAYHYQLGEQVAENQIEYLVAIGQHADEIENGAKAKGMSVDCIYKFANWEEAMTGLKTKLLQIPWILVKGSRGSHLEHIVNYLKK